MLDINYYRFAEEKAKNSIPTWLISKRYNLDVFEREGFPIRLNNTQQLSQIFNTMQEERFDIYMKEIGGFCANDLSIFISALKKSIEFQRLFFPKKDIILPLDTLMAFFVIYKKIYGLNPNAKTILEIGPGSGFSSFFLNIFESLTNYTYTEACESFYILQNNINFFMFKEQFIQHAIENEDDRTYFLPEKFSYLSGSLEKELSITYAKKTKCNYNAYPWWRLNDLANAKVQYDIVTSNANLLEFSEGALNDYLSIIKKTISDNGMFFVHCPGYNLLRNYNYLFDKLFEFKLAIVFCANWEIEYNCPKTNKKIEKKFRVPNFVIVNEKHKLYDEFYNTKKITKIVTLLQSGQKEIDDVFLPDIDYYKNRTIYTKDDIKKILLEDKDFKAD